MVCGPSSHEPTPDLPHHIIQHVFHYLLPTTTPQHISPLFLVCKSWRKAAADADLWQHHTIQLRSPEHVIPPDYAVKLHVRKKAAEAFVSFLQGLQEEERKEGSYINVHSSPSGSTIKVEQAEYVDPNHARPFNQQLQNEHPTKTLTKTLTNLTTLEIADCFSTPRRISRLLSCVSQLPALEMLDISGNLLSSAPDSLQCLTALPNLRTLDISCNYLVAASGLHHLTTVTSLQHLNVSYNRRLGERGLRQIAQLTSLAALDLSNCNVCLTETINISAEALQVLGNLSGLKMLRLRSTSSLVTEQSRECINLDFVSRLLGLEELDVGHNALDGRSCRQLTCCTALHNLDMGYCRVREEESLLPVLALPKLRAWNLSHCRHVGVPLIKRLSQMTSLTDLNLQHTHAISDAKYLKDLVNLRGLNLAATTLNLNSSLRWLCSLNMMQDLDVSEAQIGTPGMEAVVKLTSLTHLKMCITYTDDEDIPVSLCPLHKLKSLHSRFNRIDTASLAAQQLSTLTGLEELVLSNNPLGTAGVQMLTALSNLTRLELESAHLEVESLQYVLALPKLCVKVLGGNKFNQAVLEKFSEEWTAGCVQ